MKKKVNIFKRFGRFIKKNSYGFTVAVCSFVIVSALTVTSIVAFSNRDVSENENYNVIIDEGDDNVEQIVPVIPQDPVIPSTPSTPSDNNDPPVVNPPTTDVPLDNTSPVSNPEPLIFMVPLENYTLGQAYTDSELVYNATLGEWSTHQGVDFIAPSGTSVLAMCAGKVESIDYSALHGTVITISHDNNLKTIYKSLSNNTFVSVGDSVTAGQTIGETSASAGNESLIGSHLHLEMTENDVLVDPLLYLDLK